MDERILKWLYDKNSVLKKLIAFLMMKKKIFSSIGTT